MAQHIHGGILQFISQVRADHGTAGENGDILQHIFSPVAIAGSFHCNYIESTAQLVHDQGGQGFAFHILRNDQQLCAGLYDLLQQGQDLLNVGDFLVRDQDAGIVKGCFHFIHVRGHISGNISSVKLHTFHQIQFGLHGLGLFDGDNAVSAHLLHGICHKLSYFLVTGGNSGNPGDMLLAVYFLAHLGNRVHSAVGSLLHTFS